MIGTLLGHYRVESKLGEGGMGEVYRARDIKLNRDVAIKVLPERRFVVVRPLKPAQSSVVIVQNWLEEFRRAR